MNRKEETRNYKVSDADLLQLSDNIHNFANRDLADLAEFGVDATTLTTLMAAHDVFMDNPTDEELSGDMVGATYYKNLERDKLRIAIRKIADRARIKYGEQEGKFNKFGVELLSKQKDNELVRTGFRVARNATLLLADLASEGLTAQMITDLEALTTSFNSLVDAQYDAIADRDIAVVNRIRLGNALYALIVNLAAKGKLCWQDNHEAKYNDYVLTHSRGGSTSEVISGTVPGANVVNTSVTNVNNSTTITMENTGDTALDFFFAEQPTDTSGPMMTTVPPHTTLTHTAVELGYSEIENRDRFNVNNPEPEAGSYIISWE